MKYLLLVSMLVSGCSSEQMQKWAGDGKMHDSPNHQVDSKKEYMDKNLQSWKEATDKFCAMEPNGSLGECGSIAEQVATQWKSECGNPGSSDCNQKFTKMLDARERLRYHLADIQKVDLKCDAKGGCNSLDREVIMLGSHNAASWGKFVEAAYRKPTGLYCIPDGFGGMFCD